MINLKLRLKNPVFVFQIFMATILPVMMYFGVNAEDITTFPKLWGLAVSALSNPYVLSLMVLSVTNAINDPTTKGIKDSELAQDRLILK